MKKWTKDSDVIYAVDGEYSQSVCYLTSDIDTNEMEANANLIAAAPDMLEAFEGLILDININHGISLENMIGSSTRKALDKAFRAIAKAKGE